MHERRTRSQQKHAELIDAIVEMHGAETKQFWPAIADLAESEGWWDAPRGQPFRPDAFKIDRTTQTIEIHEAVITHPPSEKTLLSMGSLWFALDSEEWDLKLFLHRPDDIAPAEISLCHWYYQLLGQASAESASPVFAIDVSEAAV